MTAHIRWILALKLLLAIGLILWIGCSSDSSEDESSSQIAAMKPHDSLVIELPGMDSMTVLQVTDAVHDVEYRSSAMGSFVVRIDTIRNGPRFFWVCSVNGEMIDVAADRRMTRTGDVVRWHYRRFTP